MTMCKTKENHLAITHIDSEEIFFSCEQEGMGGSDSAEAIIPWSGGGEGPCQGQQDHELLMFCSWMTVQHLSKV